MVTRYEGAEWVCGASPCWLAIKAGSPCSVLSARNCLSDLCPGAGGT